MIEIDGKIVSTDLLTEHFCCDITACKGQCCIDGDSGAPLDIEEVDILESEYENYKPYMTAEGIAAVEKQGFIVPINIDNFCQIRTDFNGDGTIDGKDITYERWLALKYTYPEIETPIDLSAFYVEK
jgi:hypothetical protein